LYGLKIYKIYKIYKINKIGKIRLEVSSSLKSEAGNSRNPFPVSFSVASRCLCHRGIVQIERIVWIEKIDVAYSLPTVDCRLSTADCRLPTENYLILLKAISVHMGEGDNFSFFISFAGYNVNSVGSETSSAAFN
jgi:hypothetical protein